MPSWWSISEVDDAFCKYSGALKWVYFKIRGKSGRRYGNLQYKEGEGGGMRHSEERLHRVIFPPQPSPFEDIDAR
jgi:hypothetical protein